MNTYKVYEVLGLAMKLKQIRMCLPQSATSKYFFRYFFQDPDDDEIFEEEEDEGAAILGY